MKTTSKAATLALLTMAFGFPALAEAPAPPAARQERTLQDVARELKLKKDRKPGTFSATESTVNGGSDVSWSQIEASNAAYLESQREAAISRDRVPREAPVQAPAYVPDPRWYGAPARVHRPHHPAVPPVVAPKAPAVAPVPVHRAPLVSSSTRTGGGFIHRN